jgi:predicted RNA binding protein YcfA (HicA-like mRNA interferase family)
MKSFVGILSSLKYKDFEKALLKLGYRILRQKGSHVLFGNNNEKVIVIPHHKGKTIKEGLAHKIITKDLKLNIEAFKKLI